MIKKFLTTILAFLIVFPAKAELKTREFGGVLYIDESSVKELKTLFKQQGYERFLILQNNEFPAIFVRKLPSDFTNIKSLDERNSLFIRILMPLALKINEEIANEREQLLRLERNFTKNKTLSEQDIEKLEKLALKYDYFTRLTGNTRIQRQFDNLKKRIDIIPPSILIAAAALETNWGFSRIANKANSLYKEKVWFTNEGLEPLENKEDGYRFKIFDSLIDSMRSFALKFNSDIKYTYAWQTRQDFSKQTDKHLGEAIAYALVNSSNLPNYAGIVNYTAAFYDFALLDSAHLKRGFKQ